MKKIVILSALFVASGTMFSRSIAQQGKTGSTTSSTITAAKLAEAKTSFSKQPARNTKNVLATADGGI